MKQQEIFREVFEAPFGIQDQELGFDVVQRSDWYQVISSKHKVPGANEVVHSQVKPDEIDSVIDKTIAQYKGIGTPFKWCVTPYTEPENMAELLTERGFGQWNARGMYIFCDKFELAAKSNLRIDQMTEHNLEEFLITSFRGWGGDELTDENRGRLIEILQWNLKKKSVVNFLAYYEGKPAGSAGMIFKNNSVYLVSANVLKEFRGKGIYRELLVRRLKEASAKGFNLAVTHARENTSAPILEKIGFQTAYKYKVFQHGGVLPE